MEKMKIIWWTEGDGRVGVRLVAGKEIKVTVLRRRKRSYLKRANTFVCTVDVELLTFIIKIKMLTRAIPLSRTNVGGNFQYVSDRESM